MTYLLGVHQHKLDEGNVTPYAKSSDEDESFEDLGVMSMDLLERRASTQGLARKIQYPSLVWG
jgi:hypothetical protein